MDVHITTGELIILISIVVWDLVWRGMALWKSSRQKELGWFIALLVLNTAGLLPILYLVMREFNPRLPAHNLRYE